MPLSLSISTTAAEVSSQEDSIAKIIICCYSSGKYFGKNSSAIRYASLQVSSGDCRYALYPVWLLYTTWRGEKYLFAMNGQTGKFVGNLPVDRGIYWKYFCLYAAISAAVAAGLGVLLTLLGIL